MLRGFVLRCGVAVRVPFLVFRVSGLPFFALPFGVFLFWCRGLPAAKKRRKREKAVTVAVAEDNAKSSSRRECRVFLKIFVTDHSGIVLTRSSGYRASWSPFLGCRLAVRKLRGFVLRRGVAVRVPCLVFRVSGLSFFA
jgi:hypothetical protein